jgi:hypothetical protein
MILNKSNKIFVIELFKDYKASFFHNIKLLIIMKILKEKLVPLGLPSGIKTPLPNPMFDKGLRLFLYCPTRAKIIYVVI